MEKQTEQNKSTRNVPKSLILMIGLGAYISIQL